MGFFCADETRRVSGESAVPCGPLAWPRCLSGCPLLCTLSSVTAQPHPSLGAGCPCAFQGCFCPKPLPFDSLIPLFCQQVLVSDFASAPVRFYPATWTAPAIARTCHLPPPPPSGPARALLLFLLGSVVPPLPSGASSLLSPFPVTLNVLGTVLAGDTCSGLCELMLIIGAQV